MFVLILFSVTILSFRLLPPCNLSLSFTFRFVPGSFYLIHSLFLSVCLFLFLKLAFLFIAVYLPFLLPTQRTTSTSFSSLFVRMPQSCLIIHLSFSFIHFFGVNVKNVWKELNLELLLWTFFRQSLQLQSIVAVAAFPTFHRRLKKLKRWMEQTNKRVRRVEGGGRRVGRYV